VNPNTLRLRLAGSSTTSYRTTSKLEVTILANHHKNERGEVVGTDLVKTLDLVPATFTNIAAASITPEASGDEVITVTLTGASFKNRTLRLSDFTFTGNTTANTLAAAVVTRISNTVATITVDSTEVDLTATPTVVTVMGSALATRSATATAEAVAGPLADIVAASITPDAAHNLITVTLTNAVFKSTLVKADFGFSDNDAEIGAGVVTRLSDTQAAITVATGTLDAAATVVTVSEFALASQAADSTATAVSSTLTNIVADSITPAASDDLVITVTLTNAVFKSTLVKADFGFSANDTEIGAGAVVRVSNTVATITVASGDLAPNATVVTVNALALASQAAGSTAVARSSPAA